jgi:excisionase family DNA binding protein
MTLETELRFDASHVGRMNDLSQYITVREASKVLNLTPRGVNWLIENNRLKANNIGFGHLIARSDLD